MIEQDVSQIRIEVGDALSVLRAFPDQAFHTCITSPPYYGLRDYGVEGQIGREETSEAYIATLVRVFREVQRVLRDDGTFWLNVGDSYSAKSLCGIPWRLALALQADGWILRADVVWHKPNAMPGSQKDRPTMAHEYIFLLTKGPSYYYDHDAVREPAVGGAKRSGTSAFRGQRALRERLKLTAIDETIGGMRTMRSVWSVPVRPSHGAHTATFPPDLIRPCVLAGSPICGTVLDPFAGTGTTGLVAAQEGRSATLIELNPEYAAIARTRVSRSDAWDPLARRTPAPQAFLAEECGAPAPAAARSVRGNMPP